MANINPIWVQNAQKTATITWTPVTENDTGLAVDISALPDRTIAVRGTFGGGTITVEGSTDNVTFGKLHDFLGGDLDISDTRPRLIAENPPFLRIRPTAGAGMSVTVVMQATRD